MPRKETSPKVSAIAARLVNEDPLSPREPFRAALRSCGLPLSDAAADRMLDLLGATLAPYIADVKTVAASALSQDEQPKGVSAKWNEPPDYSQTE